MQDIIEKKMDLDYIYDMAQQAAEAGDIDQAIKLSEKGLKEAKLQANTEWTPKFEMFANDIKATSSYPEPEMAVIVKDKKDLTKVKGVGPTHAINLREAGYTTIEHIAKTSPKILASVKGVGLATAKKFVKAAQEYLGSSLDFKEGDSEPQEEPPLYQRLLSKYTDAEMEETPRETQPWFNEKYHIDRTSQSVSPESKVESIISDDLPSKIEELEAESEIPELIEEMAQTQTKVKNIKQLAETFRVETPISTESQETLPSQEDQVSTVSIEPKIKEEDNIIQKISKKVIIEGFHIIPHTAKEFENILSDMDLTIIKVIEAHNSKNILLICPIKINSLEDSMTISEQKANYNALVEKSLQLDTCVAELKQIQQVLLENITQRKHLLPFLQQFLMMELDVSDKVSLSSGATQFKLYIDPILISESEIQFIEKSLPFAYQRRSNIHFIEVSQLPKLLGFLERKYYYIEKYSNEEPAEEILYKAQENFKKTIRLYSIPFGGFGALVLILAISQLGFLLQTFIGLSYGILGLYAGVVSYLYYTFRQKQRKISEGSAIPHYQRAVRLDDTSIEIISHELSDDLMLQFGYECFGKTSSHKILNKIEKKHAEQYSVEHQQEDYNELFEGENEESSEIKSEYMTRFGDFLE